MSKYKIVNFSSFCIILFAATIFQKINSASAKNASSRELKLSQAIVSNQDLLEDNGSWRLSSTNLSDITLTIKSIQSPNEASELLVVDSDSEKREENIAKSQLRLKRLISWLFFLLFLIPLGTFYPLFLFYRRLLGVDHQEPDYYPGKNYEPEFYESQNSTIFDLAAQEDTSLATVSKLQIAFSPQAGRLREKLGEISSHANLNMERDVVELMHNTISALISQQDWTHVSYCSVSLPRSEIKAEFDLISYTEKNKFISQELSLIKHNIPMSDDSSSRRDLYRYIVVTLIFCTTHNIPLFNKIQTKEQLVKELTKLGKIRNNSLIKFELLWSPQQEDQYINNAQLLTEYSDMIRLL